MTASFLPKGSNRWLTLILSVATLDFLVNSTLYFALQDTCSLWFVEVGHLSRSAYRDTAIENLRIRRKTRKANGP
jgi:hypothetical protein